MPTALVSAEMVKPRLATGDHISSSLLEMLIKQAVFWLANLRHRYDFLEDFSENPPYSPVLGLGQDIYSIRSMMNR